MNTFGTGMAGIRRVIVVVLDGLRPDAVDTFDLVHLRRLMRNGASFATATTVEPSVTVAALTSLMTGVSPSVHGLRSDRIVIPKPSPSVVALPQLLARAEYPTTAFLSDIPSLFRGIASRAARALGVSTLSAKWRTAPEILMAAGTTIRRQRRGLIFFHWPDADRAGHADGWMSETYAEAAHRLDGCLAMLAALAGVPHDPSTLLIAVSDHGGGGTDPHNHESDHPFDRRIVLTLAGGAVGGDELGPATLLDVPATILWALGLEVPPPYEGRVLEEAFRARVDTPAFAVA